MTPYLTGNEMATFTAYNTEIDYLSITTFDRATFQTILTSLTTPTERRENAKQMRIRGYEGSTLKYGNGSFFWGFGTQMKRDHYMLIASGARANIVGLAVAEMILGEYNVTRIDLQYTLEKPDWYYARAVVDTFRKLEFKGRQRTITMIDNYGNDTVYIGSRSSDRFTRLYVKDKTFLRLEYEYKRDYAASAWRKIINHPERAKDGIMFDELTQLPKSPIVDHFKEYIRQTDITAPDRSKVITTPNTTYLWLRRQVEPAVYRMLNDHDARQQTIELLEGWLRTANDDN